MSYTEMMEIGFFFVFQAKESPEKTYDISDCELTDVSIALLHHLVV